METLKGSPISHLENDRFCDAIVGSILQHRPSQSTAPILKAGFQRRQGAENNLTHSGSTGSIHSPNGLRAPMVAGTL